MNEQIIILIFLVLALGATLWLYILKAVGLRIDCFFLIKNQIGVIT